MPAIGDDPYSRATGVPPFVPVARRTHDRQVGHTTSPDRPLTCKTMTCHCTVAPGAHTPATRGGAHTPRGPSRHIREGPRVERAEAGGGPGAQRYRWAAPRGTASRPRRAAVSGVPG